MKWMSIKSQLFILCSIEKELENSIYKSVELLPASFEDHKKLFKLVKSILELRMDKQLQIICLQSKKLSA